MTSIAAEEVGHHKEEESYTLNRIELEHLFPQDPLDGLLLARPPCCSRSPLLLRLLPPPLPPLRVWIVVQRIPLGVLCSEKEKRARREEVDHRVRWLQKGPSGPFQRR